MTRLRQQEKAYATLQSALGDASAILPVLKEQVARQGIAAITDREWRDRTQENRLRAARDGMRSALNEMGATVSTYFTPEEKVAFAKFAETRHAGMSPADVDAFAVPLAQSAGLGELEARWRYELMMDKGTNQNSSLLLSRMQPFVELQRQRLKFAELGAQLEQFAPRIEPQQRYAVWVAAQEAYQSAGDPEGELRAFAGMPFGTGGRDQQASSISIVIEPRTQTGCCSVLPTGILPGKTPPTSSWQTAMRRRRTLWFRRVGAPARQSGRNPTTRSSDSILRRRTPEVNSAFVSALGDNTIAERLSQAG